MSSIWTLKEKSQGELEVTLAGEEWQKAQKKALDKVVKSVKIDGFRQGHAPLALIKKQISNEQILMEAVELSAQKALEEGFQEHKLDVIDRPKLDVKSVNEEEAVLSFVVTVRPVVTLGQYKGLTKETITVEVTEDEIDHEVGHILEDFAELIVREDDAVIETGDIAVIDFEGFVDGVAFEGGKAENYPLEIGSGSFIPGFEEQLIGVKSGKSKTVTVSFPEQYGEPTLAGKEAKFECKVNEIKRKQLPELDEEIIKDLGRDGIQTPEELRADIKEKLLVSKKNKEDDRLMDGLLETITASSTVDIPDVMVQEEADNLMIEFSQRLQQSGYSIEAFQEATGQTEEQIKSQMWEDATGRVTTRLVLEAIATAEEIKITPEEVEAEYANLAARFQMELARVKQMARVDMVSYDLALRKASNLVKESSN